MMGPNLPHPNFPGAPFAGAQFAAKGPNLPGPDLPPTKFPGPSLPPRDPICRGPICHQQNFRGPICRLGAQFAGARFAGAQSAGAQFAGAQSALLTRSQGLNYCNSLIHLLETAFKKSAFTTLIGVPNPMRVFWDGGRRGTDRGLRVESGAVLTSRLYLLRSPG